MDKGKVVHEFRIRYQLTELIEDEQGGYSLIIHGGKGCGPDLPSGAAFGLTEKAVSEGLTLELGRLLKENKQQEECLKEIVEALTEKPRTGLSLVAYINSVLFPNTQVSQRSRLNEALEKTSHKKNG